MVGVGEPPARDAMRRRRAPQFAGWNACTVEDPAGRATGADRPLQEARRGARRFARSAPAHPCFARDPNVQSFVHPPRSAAGDAPATKQAMVEAGIAVSLSKAVMVFILSSSCLVASCCCPGGRLATLAACRFVPSASADRHSHPPGVHAGSVDAGGSSAPEQGPTGLSSPRRTAHTVPRRTRRSRPHRESGSAARRTDAPPPRGKSAADTHIDCCDPSSRVGPSPCSPV